MSGEQFEIRPGLPRDVPAILRLMRSMAEFEQLECHATEASLLSNLFGESPAAKTLLVFCGNQAVGYATYFFSFASMVGRRCLWIDDCFVESAYRNKGIGKALFERLANVAKENHCARLEWIVLNWNSTAITFYERMGAEMLPQWRLCRLDLGREV